MLSKQSLIDSVGAFFSKPHLNGCLYSRHQSDLGFFSFRDLLLVFL